MAEDRRRPRLCSAPAGVVRSARSMLLVEDKMIGREPGRIVITCDACGRLLQGDSDEWIDVWPRASRAGWRARKIGKEWCQFCGELCASKLTDDQIRHRH